MSIFGTLLGKIGGFFVRIGQWFSEQAAKLGYTEREVQKVMEETGAPVSSIEASRMLREAREAEELRSALQRIDPYRPIPEDLHEEAVFKPPTKYMYSTQVEATNLKTNLRQELWIRVLSDRRLSKEEIEEEVTRIAKTLTTEEGTEWVIEKVSLHRALRR